MMRLQDVTALIAKPIQQSISPAVLKATIKTQTFPSVDVT
jgi:shikimate 5-dehydrogenase